MANAYTQPLLHDSSASILRLGMSNSSHSAGPCLIFTRLVELCFGLVICHRYSDWPREQIWVVFLLLQRYSGTGLSKPQKIPHSSHSRCFDLLDQVMLIANATALFETFGFRSKHIIQHDLKRFHESLRPHTSCLSYSKCYSALSVHVFDVKPSILVA